MISGADYDRLRKGDSLRVYYQSSLDEMMSVDYSFGFYLWVFLAMVWLIAVWLVFSGRKSKKTS